MTTYHELGKNIGKSAKAHIPTDGKGTVLVLDCTITNSREVWGRIDYQVEIQNQKIWLSESRIELCELQ